MYFSKSLLLVSKRNASTKLNDAIHIKKLNVTAKIGNNLWNIPTKQAVKLSIDYNTDFSKSSENDDLSETLNYAVMSNSLMKEFDNERPFKNIVEVNDHVRSFINKKYSSINENIGVKSMDKKFSVNVEVPNNHLRTNNIELRTSNVHDLKYTLNIKNIQSLTYIGVFTFERLQKQYINVSLSLKLNHIHKALLTDSLIKKICNNVADFLDKSMFKTVEALVNDAGGVIYNTLINENVHLGLLKAVEVSVVKPQAILQCDGGVGVSCLRTLDDYAEELKSGKYEVQLMNQAEGFNLPVSNISENSNLDVIDKDTVYKVYLSIGTNMGNKLNNIFTAIKNLSSHPEVLKIDKISSIFQSEPMYYEDQDRFYNSTLSLYTRLPPTLLLKELKRIEYNDLSRVKKFDNGPRTIDLDIIYYLKCEKNSQIPKEHIVLNTKDLVIPHKSMLERAFVLGPLQEILSPDGVENVHPISFEPITNQLSQIKDLGINRVLMFKNNRFLNFDSNDNLKIMKILNYTNDSFSDGGLNYEQYDEAIKEVDSLKLNQRDIVLDVGCCSTNPLKKEEQISPELENERCKEILTYIRNKNENIIISLDTYRNEVIKENLEKIDIINDIGFEFEKRKQEISAILAGNRDKSYVLNHVPCETFEELQKIQKTKTTSDPNVNQTVCDNLIKKFNFLIQNGVLPSQVIIDPGLGFGKTKEECFEIIRNFRSVWEESNPVFKSIPILYGYSRKRFLKTYDNNNTVDRDLEGSLVLSKLLNKNNIVRVHNLEYTQRSILLLRELYKK